jgi:DNA polymerase-3 subunit epsilon/ATP-dependent DNA helicase DinG
LDDAQATRQLVEALLDQARRLDGRIIQEVARISGHTNWQLAGVFRDLSRERRYSAPVGTLGQQLAAKGLMDTSAVDGGYAIMRVDEGDQTYDPPLKPVPTSTPLDVDKLCRLLEKDGRFERQFAGFEYRLQQVDMLASVVGAFNESTHLMVEAGTGTGKSMAYLIPTIYWAVQNGQRVVISTHTINLQDQLLNKDIPTLQQILPLKFKAVALKGRSNYVCPRRVQLFRAKENLSPKELRLLAKLLIWMPSTTTGDREELFMPDYEERALWGQVASDGNLCSPRTCTADTCFYARARRNAESAHVIIVNHALLLADIAVDNRVIPDYQYLIIDEAHHLEDTVTNQLSFKANQKLLEQLLTELSQTLRGSHRTGFIHEIARRSLAVVPHSVKGDINDIVHQSDQAVDKSRQATQQLFSTLTTFVNEFPGSGRYNQKIRLTEQTRTQPAWSNVELTWDNTGASLAQVSKALGILYTMLTELESYDVPNWEELLATLTYYRNRLDEIRSNMQTILAGPNPDRILWVEQDVRNKTVSLHNAPLHVGNLVNQHLTQPKESVVLTSATLRTNNSFDYFRERLHFWEAEEAAVGSPFDYESSTLLYIPTDIPEPNTPGHQKAVEAGLISLVKQIKGRTLVLFTSYSQLRTTAHQIKGPLAEADIVVYQQGDGTSRRQLLENFRNAEQAVLLGTRSFWEGVDIPGPALSCVVLTRIPFAVPSDPIISARSETFDDAFNQYSIPQAILTFRQGFGRLIRTAEDRGVIVTLDRRVITKSYGQALLDSLPGVTERRGLLADLPHLAEDWIDYGGI